MEYRVTIGNPDAVWTVQLVDDAAVIGRGENELEALKDLVAHIDYCPHCDCECDEEDEDGPGEDDEDSGKFLRYFRDIFALCLIGFFLIFGLLTQSSTAFILAFIIWLVSFT